MILEAKVEKSKNGSMFAQVRRQKILDSLRVLRSVKVKDLKSNFGVTAITINRDLKELENEGLLKCVHGGAVLPRTDMRELQFSKREVVNADLKKAIAKVAARYVTEHMSVFLDGSTTAACLGHQLRLIPLLSIVTDSLSAFLDLQEANQMEVNLLGGVLQHDGNTVGGPLAQRNVANMYFEVCFFSAACFDEGGIYNLFPTGVQVKESAIVQSKKVILIADSTKYGKRGVWKLADWSHIDIVVSDNRLPESAKTMLEANNCQVVLAPV